LNTQIIRTNTKIQIHICNIGCVTFQVTNRSEKYTKTDATTTKQQTLPVRDHMNLNDVYQLRQMCFVVVSPKRMMQNRFPIIVVHTPTEINFI
jgi:hypothetical protein